jgi:iron complex outermembrane receptor protein
VVVGSRSGPRSAIDSPSPVTVVSGEELRARGYIDLAHALEVLIPSFNFPPVSTTPTGAGSRPATLRGLSPSQVLVLVNGKRRHAAAVINSNNGIGRGTVPVDFNAIPVAAVERIEVLRDGAAAQYGSDAIAGVVNVVLYAGDGEGMAAVQGGLTSRGDGGSTVVEGRQTFGGGGGGDFLMLAGDVRYHGFTNVAGIDPRFGRVTARLSEPQTLDFTAAANAEHSVGAGTVYGFLTANRRAAEMSPLFRAPTVAPAFYPNGFLPLIQEDITDLGGAGGLRGEALGWSFDLSDTAGYDRGDFRATNSVNTSLGAASPTSFDSGGAAYWQNLVNLTVTRHLPALAGLNLALGLEQRHEHYRIRRGETASFAGVGAQGFPGFNPPSPVDVARDAFSAFVDAEFTPASGLEFGLAGRYEHYSDFGAHATGKASFLWRPIPTLALRATASTGFRAPTLQEQYYSTVTSQLLVATGQISNVGNFAVTDPVSRALGASPLRPEVSTDYSVGAVLTPTPRLVLTADVYRIRIRDRIALSENLTGGAVAAILAAHGITNASAVRFFTNAADTRTAGWEGTAKYTTPLAGGQLDVNLGYGAFDSDLVGLHPNPVLPQLPLLAVQSISVLIDGQPRNKTTVNLVYSHGPWRAGADVVRYGGFHVVAVATEQVFGPATTLDLTLSREFPHGLTAQAGVLNVTDQHGDTIIGATDGRRYVEAGGVGLSGMTWFAGLTSRF